MYTPNIDDFQEWYKLVPQMPSARLHELFMQTSKYGEYALLSSLVSRVLTSLNLKEGLFQDALTWSRKALDSLNDSFDGSIMYGSNEDYIVAMHASILVRMRVLSQSIEAAHWFEAKKLGENILQHSFPSLFTKSNTQKEGIHIALMLMGVYHRLGEHPRSIDLAVRLQKEAQEHKDIPVELRATMMWVLGTILYAKEHRMNERDQEAEALLSSAVYVSATLAQMENIDVYLGGIPMLLWIYARYLNGVIDSFAMNKFLDVASETVLVAALDLVQTHSCQQDEAIQFFLVQTMQRLELLEKE